MTSTPSGRRDFMRQAAAWSVVTAAAPVASAAAPASAATMSAHSHASAAPLDPLHLTRQDELLLWGKLKADLSGRTLYAITTGTVWGFRPQADDLALADFARRLYGYATCVARRGSVDSSGNVVLQTKSWNFYLDPETGAFTTTLFNPYTGKSVTSAPMLAPSSRQVYSVEGPVLSAPSIPVETRQTAEPFDLRVRRIGERAFVTETSFMRFKPRDTTWFKLEGNIWMHSCLARDLADSALSHIPSSWNQNLVAEWQTWMEMHGSPGHILFQGEGCHVAHVEEIPADIRASIEQASPGSLDETLAWG